MPESLLVTRTRLPARLTHDLSSMPAQGNVFSISYLYGRLRVELRHELPIVTASWNPLPKKRRASPLARTGPACPTLFLSEDELDLLGYPSPNAKPRQAGTEEDYGCWLGNTCAGLGRRRAQAERDGLAERDRLAELLSQHKISRQPHSNHRGP